MVTIINFIKNKKEQLKNGFKWYKVIKDDSKDSDSVVGILLFKYTEILSTYEENNAELDNATYQKDLDILKSIVKDLHLLQDIQNSNFDNPVFEHLEGEKNMEDYREKVQVRVFGRIGRNLEKYYSVI